MTPIKVTCEMPGDMDSIIQLITKPEYLESRYQRLQPTNLNICVESDNETEFKAAVHRDVNIRERAPGFARKLVKEVMRVTHTHAWSKDGIDEKNGTFEAIMEGMPGKLFANLSLTPITNGQHPVLMTFDGYVEVKIALIGGRLEKFMQGVAEEKIEELLLLTREYLEEHLAK